MRTIDDLKINLENGESETIEFKSSMGSYDSDISRIISAFGNSKGGVLLIGVNKSGEIIGIPDNQIEYSLTRARDIFEMMASMNDISGSVSNHVIDGKNVIAIEVDVNPDKTNSLLTSQGKAYIRTGTDIEEYINPDKIQIHLDYKKDKYFYSMGPLDVFVAMSFRNEEEPHLEDYYEAMKRAAEKTGLPLNVKRMDDFEGDYEISNEILAKIDGAQIVVADFTLSSRNVYFELGYARGTNKEIIQTARWGTQLEFDTRNWKTIFYRNAKMLEEQLPFAFEDRYIRIFKKQQNNFLEKFNN